MDGLVGEWMDARMALLILSWLDGQQMDGWMDKWMGKE